MLEQPALDPALITVVIDKLRRGRCAADILSDLRTQHGILEGAGYYLAAAFTSMREAQNIGQGRSSMPPDIQARLLDATWKLYEDNPESPSLRLNCIKTVMTLYGGVGESSAAVQGAQRRIMALIEARPPAGQDSPTAQIA